MSIVRESLLHMDTNDKREDAADSSPFRGFEVPEDVVVDINNDQGEDEGASKDNTDEIDEMNTYFLMRMRVYEKILSPQLEKNEKLKSSFMMMAKGEKYEYYKDVSRILQLYYNYTKSIEKEMLVV